MKPRSPIVCFGFAAATAVCNAKIGRPIDREDLAELGLHAHRAAIIDGDTGPAVALAAFVADPRHSEASRDALLDFVADRLGPRA